MLKPLLTLAAVGFVGVTIWKLILLPLLAGWLGFFVKVAIVVAIALAVLWLFRKREGGKEGGEARAG